PLRCHSFPTRRSSDLLLLALLDGATDASRVLTDAGATRDTVLAALAEVRGSQRVTDPNPEEKYQALERYGRDLTDLARGGKLDRSEEHTSELQSRFDL